MVEVGRTMSSGDPVLRRFQELGKRLFGSGLCASEARLRARVLIGSIERLSKAEPEC